MDANGPVKLNYAKLEYINSSARIVLVGITPRPAQMVNGNTKSRRVLFAGKANGNAIQAANASGPSVGCEPVPARSIGFRRNCGNGAVQRGGILDHLQNHTIRLCCGDDQIRNNFGSHLVSTRSNAKTQGTSDGISDGILKLRSAKLLILRMNWLPLVTSYRTLCIAPPPDLQFVFNNLAGLSAREVQP